VKGTLTALALAGVLLAATGPSIANAGGFFITERGARPLGRGFAFVAGADDAGAIWHNPAGISGIGRSLFIDATLVMMTGSFTRIDSGGNVQPTVPIDHAPLPVPMLAWTDDFGLADWDFGAAFIAPNGLQFRWPEHVEVAGERVAAPQRYSLISMEGSLFSAVSLAAAWRPHPRLALGVSLNTAIGGFRTLVAVSACDRVLCSQPENPDYDGLVEVHQQPLIEFNATVGLTYAHEWLRVGASFSTPYTISGEADMRVRLPSASIFRGATVEGDSVELELPFPWVARLGVELRPVDAFRVELAAAYEAWSRQDAVRIVPNDVWIRGAAAIGDYQVGPLVIPRNMRDVISLRLGGAYEFGPSGVRVSLGANYETSSFADSHLSPLTLDSDKLVLGAGVRFPVSDEVAISVSYGHIFLADRQVRDSQVPQTNPIRPEPASGTPPPGGPVFVGDGDYVMEADMFGLGLEWRPSPEASGDLSVGG